MTDYSEYPLRAMVDDCQIVEINQVIGYAWEGEDFLSVGDVVVLPAKDKNGEWVGTVTGLGSRWPFEFKKVIRLAQIEDIEAQEARLEARAAEEAARRAKRK